MGPADKAQKITGKINEYSALPSKTFLFFDIFAGARGKKSVKAMHDDLIQLVNNWSGLALSEEEAQLKAFVTTHQEAFFGGGTRESIFKPVLEEIGYGDIVAAWNRDLERKSASYQF